MQLMVELPRLGLLHCSLEQLGEDRSPHASDRIPALSAVETIRECELTTSNGVITLGDISEGICVLVDPWVKETHLFLS